MRTLKLLRSHLLISGVVLSLLSSSLAACQSTGGFPTLIQNEQPTRTAQITETSQSELELESTVGITVTTTSFCSDGTNSTLFLETELDTNLWKLDEKDFFPLGKTYFETRIVLPENEVLFSTSSSGQRDDPVYHPSDGLVSTKQTFVFPKTAQPTAVYLATAQGSLLDLPLTYTSPAEMELLEPGVLEIPVKFIVPVTLGGCP